jgi:chromosome segregation ATPase
MTTERWTDESLDRFAATITTAIAANVELIAANAGAIAASNERLTRIEQLQESAARSIQALGDDIAELRLTVREGFEQSSEERAELRQATLGIANLLASLDSDRPTILRKLNAIENKVDSLSDAFGRILEKEDRQAG